MHKALPNPMIMLVTDSERRHDRASQGAEWVDDVVREATLGGVNVVQLRDKKLSHADLIRLGLHVRDAIGGRALFFVNSDADAAVALNADGIHLPDDGSSPARVRTRIGEARLFSCAVHSPNAAIAAERGGADFVVAGAVFDSVSHPGVTPLGLDGLAAIATSVEIPVVAIGGITADNAASVMRAGAAGVAVIGAIFDSDDPRQAAAQLRDAVSNA
jgi:thiamine-phosphate diphosphorylase